MLLSPKPIQPEQVIPVAIPTSTPQQQAEIKSTITKNIAVTPSISQLKLALESKNDTAASMIKVARPSTINKEIKPLNSRYPSEDRKSFSPVVTKKEEVLPSQPFKKEITTKPIDKSLLNKYNSNNGADDSSSTPNQLPTRSIKTEIPVKEKRDSYPLVKPPPVPTSSILQEKRSTYSPIQPPTTPNTPTASRGLEARKQALFTSNSPDNKNTETTTSPKKDVQSRYRPNNSRESSTDSSLQKKKENPLPSSSTLLKTRPLPPRVSSLPNNDTPTHNFLLEAKQKLFAVQQQQRQIQPPAAKKTLPVAPPMVRQQSGQVVVSMMMWSMCTYVKSFEYLYV